MLPVPEFGKDRRRFAPPTRYMQDPFAMMKYNDVASSMGKSPKRTALVGKQAMERLGQLFAGTLEAGRLCVEGPAVDEAGPPYYFAYMSDGADRTCGAPNAYGSHCPLYAAWLSLCGELQVREEFAAVGQHALDEGLAIA